MNFKNILIISLSNIGDVILTFPVIDAVKNRFPQSKISVVVGPKAVALLENNPNLEEVIVFDKHQSALNNFKWVCALRKYQFDLIIDLRNTAIKLFLMPITGTSILFNKKNMCHMREKHLNRLGTVVDVPKAIFPKISLNVSEEDRARIDALIPDSLDNYRYVVVSPSAADKAKRWPTEGYSEVCRRWIEEHHLKIVLVGDGEQDKAIAKSMVETLSTNDVVNLCGRISLTQLALILKRCLLAFGNDSAVMHMASYLDRPVLTLFGPTDPVKYGPWSSNCYFIKKKEMSFFNYKDMDWKNNSDCITVEDVIAAVDINGDEIKFNNAPR